MCAARVAASDKQRERDRNKGKGKGREESLRGLTREEPGHRRDTEKEKEIEREREQRVKREV